MTGHAPPRAPLATEKHSLASIPVLQHTYAPTSAPASIALVDKHSYAQSEAIPQQSSRSQVSSPIVPRIPHPPRAPFPGNRIPHPPSAPYPGTATTPILYHPETQLTRPANLGVRDSIPERLHQLRREREEIKRSNLRDQQARDRRESENFDRWCRGESWATIIAPPPVRSSHSSTSPAPTPIETRLSTESAPHSTLTPLQTHSRQTAVPHHNPQSFHAHPTPPLHSTHHLTQSQTLDNFRQPRPQSSRPQSSRPQSREARSPARNESLHNSRPREPERSSLSVTPKVKDTSKRF